MRHKTKQPTKFKNENMHHYENSYIYFCVKKKKKKKKKYLTNYMY